MDYNRKWFIKAGVLLLLTATGQMLGLSYPASILVNMFIFTAVTLIGSFGAAAIGILTPVIGFQLGFLPADLAAMLPFIIAGNIGLVIIYQQLGTKDKLLALGAAAFIKFVILSSGVRYLSELPQEIANMMRASQLFTAVVGGLLSFIVLNLLVRIDNEKLQLFNQG